MITTLIAFTLTAHADDSTQTTNVGGQELVNALGSLYAAQRDAEARLSALEARRSSNKGIDKARIEELESAIGDLSDLVAEMSGIDTDHDDQIAELQTTIDALKARLSELEVVLWGDVYEGDLYVSNPVVEVRSSGFHPVLYVGGQMVVGMPIEGVNQRVTGRFTVGVRPQWDVGSHAVGLNLEVDRELGGWGTRVVPAFYFGPFGVGGGVGYNCSVLTDEGCMTERTGAVGRLSWEKGKGLVGVIINGDLEGSYVTIPGEEGVEVRGLLGASFYFGNSHPRTVTVDTTDSDDLDSL